MPLHKAGLENHRALSALPQDPPLQSARKSRLIISWWDREVSIWRLPSSLSDLVDNSNGEQIAAKNRKLLARILIRGEANITSASISAGGSLLVVSTTSDIKAFHLKPRDGIRWDELKISKIDLDERITALGATRTLISPDGQWVCLVQAGGNLLLLRIDKASDPSLKPTVYPKIFRLHRIHRQVPKHVAVGGLGRYDRTITLAAFSPDSRMLAVADLAGYIDTWVLGEQPRKLQNGENRTDNGAVSDDSSSESDNDGEEVDIDSNLRWRQNPNTSLIPKLSAAPTVLSFSEHIPSRNEMAGTDETDDYTLLAVTSRPQIVLIHPTLGSLAAWSRRNPISRFPAQFRDIRDLVKGSLWTGDRLWLYGHSYLLMIDLSQDLPEPISEGLTTGSEVVAQGRKRKRGPDTGAGNRMASGALGPSKVVRHTQGGESEEFPVDGALPDPMDEDAASQVPGNSEGDESDDDIQGELALLRGAQRKSTQDSQPKQKPAFWFTLKYRPILGIVPLSQETQEQQSGGSMQVAINGAKENALEVALVERPLFEMDLPDRYFAEGEVER